MYPNNELVKMGTFVIITKIIPYDKVIGMANMKKAWILEKPSNLQRKS